MALLADVPGRARFNLSYTEVLELPVKTRDRMLEQMQEWRTSEDAQARKLKG